jgi:hypothetical protein
VLLDDGQDVHSLTVGLVASATLLREPPSVGQHQRCSTCRPRRGAELKVGALRGSGGRGHALVGVLEVVERVARRRQRAQA